MTEIKSWGDALSYTISTRHSWRHGNGAKTAHINANHFTRLRGSSFPIKKITQPVIGQVCIELEEEGKTDATINRIVSAVSTCLNHCAFDGLIEQPPKFRRRAESEGRPLFYTKEQVDQMYDISKEIFQREDLADILMVGAYTGMRQGELLKLKVKDIDWTLNTIHVGGRPDVQTKASNYRTVPIHDKVTHILRSRYDGLAGGVRVFDDWHDKDQLLRAFNKVRRFAGIEDTYVFHCLRHSFATWCAEAGVPIRTLMDLMGHKRIETTLRYAKTTDKARTDALALI